MNYCPRRLYHLKPLSSTVSIPAWTGVGGCDLEWFMKRWMLSLEKAQKGDNTLGVISCSCHLGYVTNLTVWEISWRSKALLIQKWDRNIRKDIFEQENLKNILHFTNISSIYVCCTELLQTSPFIQIKRRFTWRTHEAVKEILCNLAKCERKGN